MIPSINNSKLVEVEYAWAEYNIFKFSPAGSNRCVSIMALLSMLKLLKKANVICCEANMSDITFVEKVTTNLLGWAYLQC